MADLPFQIIVDDDGSVIIKRFGDTVSTTGKKTASVAARMTKSFRNLGAGLRRLPGVVFNLRNAIIGLGAAAVLRGIIRAGDEVEKARVRLIGLRGSVEEANKTFEFFQSVASEVAFSLRDVVQAGVTLESFGAESKDTLEAVTDLAAFMGTDIPTAAAAFGRAFAGGAGAADILRERGVLTLVRLRTGIDDLTKLTLPQFRKALLAAFVDTTGPIAGSAKRLGDTFTGALSFAADAVFKLQVAFAEAGFLDLAKELISNFTEFAKVMLDLSEENVPAIQEFVESLRRLIPTTETMIKGAFLAARAFEGFRIILLEVGRAVIVLGTAVNVLFLRFREARMLRSEFRRLGAEIDNSADRMFRLVRAQDRLIAGLRTRRTLQKQVVDQEELAFQAALTEVRTRRAEDDRSEATAKRRTRRAELTRDAIAELGEFAFGTSAQIENAVATSLFKVGDLFETNALVVANTAQGILESNFDILGRSAVELRNTHLDAVRFITKASEDTVGAIFTTLQGVREAEQIAILADLESFKGSQEEKLAFVRSRVAQEIELERIAKFDASAELLSGLAALAETEGKRLFEVSKALRLGEAVVNTFAAANAILADPALIGRPFLRFALAGAAIAQGLANVNRIRSAKPGGGVGGGGGGGAPGGGGGGGGAPAGGAPADQQGGGQAISVSINVAGFVGDEALLASEIGRVQREAFGDDVETTLSQ